MSTHELASTVYRYSLYYCKSTYLDYRDIAHSVIVKVLPKIRAGKVKYIKVYLQYAIRSEICGLIGKNQHEFVELTIDIPLKIDFDRSILIDEIYAAAQKKDRLIVHRLLEDRSREEIAEELGSNVFAVNQIWKRAKNRIRGKLKI